MDNSLLEDGKVIGSASLAVLVGYAEIFNQLITLGISVCTFIYVANRAYLSLVGVIKSKKKRKKRK